MLDTAELHLVFSAASAMVGRILSVFPCLVVMRLHACLVHTCTTQNGALECRIGEETKKAKRGISLKCKKKIGDIVGLPIVLFISVFLEGTRRVAMVRVT